MTHQPFEMAFHGTKKNQLFFIAQKRKLSDFFSKKSISEKKRSHVALWLFGFPQKKWKSFGRSRVERPFVVKGAAPS